MSESPFQEVSQRTNIAQGSIGNTSDITNGGTLRMIPLIATVVAILLLELSIATFVEVKSSEAASRVIGLVFSQIVLCAVWCTLAPLHLMTRMMIGISVFAIAVICMYLCAKRDGGGDSMATTIALAMLIQWCLYQVPMWHTRLRGWCLCFHEVQPSQSQADKTDLQFGIAQLLVWTTVVACFLAVIRLLLQFAGSGNVGGGGNPDVSLFVTLALGNSLLILPLVYACFSINHILRWLAIAAGWAMFVTIAEALLLRGAGSDFGFIAMINVVQFFSVLGTLFTVRWAGFRLHQNGAATV